MRLLSLTVRVPSLRSCTHSFRALAAPQPASQARFLHHLSSYDAQRLITRMPARRAAAEVFSAAMPKVRSTVCDLRLQPVTELQKPACRGFTTPGGLSNDTHAAGRDRGPGIAAGAP